MNTNFSNLGFESNFNCYNPDWNNHSVDWVQHDSIGGGEHFPTAHIDDLDGRVNQLMAARFAHAPSHTYAPPKSCSYCYNHAHHINKCPFITHYTSMIDEDDARNSNHKHVPATTILESEEIVDNDEQEEKEEYLQQIEPPSTPNLSNDKEMSTEAHSFITIPFETLHETQASVLQCLKEPSYDKFVKDLCTQGNKSMNHLPKKIIRSKQVGYLRWRNILPEGYQILRKKEWKGLVGHPNDRGK
jgi:hypothetical protein